MVQQCVHLVVFGLFEIRIPGAYPEERIGGFEAYDLIALLAQLLDGLARRDGDCQYKLLRTGLSCATQRRYHCPAGRNAIVYNDDRASMQVRWLAVTEIGLSPPFQLNEFAMHFCTNIVWAWSNQSHRLLVQNKLWADAIDYRADAIFLMTWRADLAYEQQIERRIEHLCNLIGDRYAAARQRENQRRIISVSAERHCQPPPGIAPVPKQWAHYIAPSCCGKCFRNQRPA